MKVLEKNFVVKNIFWLLLVIWVAKNMTIALLLDPWQAEDEFDHFGYVTILYRTDAWFVPSSESYGSEEAVRARELWEQQGRVTDVRRLEELKALRSVKNDYWVTTTYQPPAYYAFLSLFYSMFDFLDIYSLVYILRMMSVLMSALMIWTVGLFFEEIQLSEKSKLMALLFLVFNPQFSLLNSVINPEVLILLLFAVLIYLLARGLRRGWNHYQIVGMAGTIALGLLTKQTMVFGILLSGMVVGYEWWQNKLRKSHVLWGLGSMILVSVLVLPVYRAINNQTNYFGEVVAINTISKNEYILGQFDRLKNMGYESFWQMNYAKLPYQAPPIFVRTTRLWLLLGVVGLSFIAFEYNKKWRWQILIDSPNKLLAVSSVLSAAALLFMLIYWDLQRLTFNFQFWFKGRYLFPFIVPITWIWVEGLRQIRMKIGRYENLVLISWLGFWIAFQMLCIQTLVLAYTKI